MIWLAILKRFWTVPVFAVLIGLLWWQGAQSDKIRSDRDRWHKSADTYDAAWKSWAASYWESERLRGEDSRQAVNASSEDAKACDIRVKSARASSSAITRIVTKEVQCAPGSVPVRSLISPVELRNALTPAAASSPAKAESGRP